MLEFDIVGRELPRKPTDFTACEGHYILNEHGEPVAEPDLFAWAEWLEKAYRTPRARHLAEDTVGPYLVSTVFLAIDHAYGGGRPVLWDGGGIRDHPRETAEV